MKLECTCCCGASLLFESEDDLRITAKSMEEDFINAHKGCLENVRVITNNYLPPVQLCEDELG